jgi:hypothetical protein
MLLMAETKVATELLLAIERDQHSVGFHHLPAGGHNRC